MADLHSPPHSGLFWKFNNPHGDSEPVVIVIIADWIYGLLPYCGPGTRVAAWERERAFQNDLCAYLLQLGFATLSLEKTDPDNNPPNEYDLVDIHSAHELRNTLHQIMHETRISEDRIIFFGHGFGCYLPGKLAASGFRPAGYILASGLYSATDAILEMKYLSIESGDGDIPLIRTWTPDPETAVILRQFGNILYASRKGRERKHLLDGDVNLDLYLPKELFINGESSSFVFSHLNASSLIIHGSGDLDIPVSNAFYLEQKLKQEYKSVSRIILLDCDHWFKEMPGNGDERMSERLFGKCIERKTDARFYQNINAFLRDIIRIWPKTARSSAE